MTKKIKNFSRHPFNADQVQALEGLGYSVGNNVPLAPFFKNGEDFLAQVGGGVVSAVVPANILLEAQGLLTGRNKSFSLILWSADQAARKRGNFAATGVSVWEIAGTPGPGSEAGDEMAEGEWLPAISISQEISVEFSPTVENSFRTGEEYPYHSSPITGEAIIV